MIPFVSGPPMLELTVGICPEDWSGTNDYVRFWFQTCSSISPGCNNRKWCVTNWIHGFNKWKKGTMHEIHQHVLATCSTGNLSGKLRSVNSLEVKAEVQSVLTTELATVAPDILKLCNISVEFGDKGDSDYNKWTWTGEAKKTKQERNGWFTNWIELAKNITSL